MAALTPYQPVGDEQVHRFLEESGYTVTKVIGLKCDTATSIAHTPRDEVIDVILNELDGDDVDAIVQAGTNLSTLDIFPALEHQLGKPLIPINMATIWHALSRPRHRRQVLRQGLAFRAVLDGSPAWVADPAGMDSRLARMKAEHQLRNPRSAHHFGNMPRIPLRCVDEREQSHSHSYTQRKLTKTVSTLEETDAPP